MKSVYHRNICLNLVGVNNPLINDTLAIYTPPGNSTILSVAPYKFRNLSDDGNYLKSGNATFT